MLKFSFSFVCRFSNRIELNESRIIIIKHEFPIFHMDSADLHFKFAKLIFFQEFEEESSVQKFIMLNV